ncbi:MAG: hypothetical protein KBG20_15395 [Caldilineaceae bacterium]|nr:hypothetical protein [Caldilineaceae bacterium]MBP8107500.1 hypothetical protein [Caldilineaceae bacterium]MBP8123013.1 hypothetical protein [Caldilineaceae bacterium]MBP9073691.1 hypothetical protein [Caldilineaceae bacterium]
MGESIEAMARCVKLIGAKTRKPQRAQRTQRFFSSFFVFFVLFVVKIESSGFGPLSLVGYNAAVLPTIHPDLNGGLGESSCPQI